MAWIDETRLLGQLLTGSAFCKKRHLLSRVDGTFPISARYLVRQRSAQRTEDQARKGAGNSAGRGSEGINGSARMKHWQICTFYRKDYPDIQAVDLINCMKLHEY